MTVKLSEEEYAKLNAMAEVQGLSVPRLLMRSTFAGGSTAAMQQQLLRDEMRGVTRLLGRIGTLLNQLTAATHATGVPPVELDPALRAVQAASARLERAAESLAEGPGR